MCGRFTLRSSPQAVAEAFALPDVPELFPRFNIAPGEPVAVVRQPAVSKSRELAFLRWSLIPAWADDPSIGERLAPGGLQNFRLVALRQPHDLTCGGGRQQPHAQFVLRLRSQPLD